MDRPQAAAFWDREVAARTHMEWMAFPEVREYINRKIGGEEPRWPIDWFDEWLRGRKFARALSIGCGTGALERDLVRRGLCAEVDAFDGSLTSLAEAHRAAVENGLADRIHYFAADFNIPAFRRRAYDAVFFHQSAHHVQKLEKLFRAILRALKRNGLLYLDEYVGPSRFEWRPELLAAQEAAYAALPRAVRLTDSIPLPIQEDDPSEALRSSEIEKEVSIGFRTVARRPYGGTFLSVVMPLMARKALTPQRIRELIEDEEKMLSEGAPSYYAVIVARPRIFPLRLAAHFRYFFEPKAKRVWIETRRKIVGY